MDMIQLDWLSIQIFIPDSKPSYALNNRSFRTLSTIFIQFVQFLNYIFVFVIFSQLTDWR